MQVLVFLAGLGLGIYVHELGHAAAAWIVGFRIHLVRVGVGPVLLQARLGTGCALVLHLLPLSGNVTAFPKHLPQRMRQSVFILGGVAANAGLLCLLAAAAAWGKLPGEVAKPLAAAQLFLVIRNLVPFRSGIVLLPGTGGTPSDGLALCHKLFSRAETPSPDEAADIVRELEGGDAPTEVPAPPPADLAEAAFHLVRLNHPRNAWERRHACDAIVRLLRDGRLAGPIRAVVLAVLVEHELLHGGTGTTPGLLDAWSAEAVSLLPTPGMEVTRGAVLLRLGRTEDGTALLRSVLARTAKIHVASIAQALLAQAAARGGDDDTARTLFRKARAPLYGDLPQGAGIPIQAAGSDSRPSSLLAIVDRLEAETAGPARHRDEPAIRADRLVITPAALLACIVITAAGTWLVTYTQAISARWEDGFATACEQLRAADDALWRNGYIVSVCAPATPPNRRP